MLTKAQRIFFYNYIPEVVVSCDPGIHGAIAVIGEDQITAFKIPFIKTASGYKLVDIQKLLKDLKKVIKGREAIGVFEQPFFGASMSKKSAFTFGMATAGVVYCLLETCKEVVSIKPKIWKRAMGLSRDKNDSLILLGKLLSEDFVFTIQRDHNVAEAILMGFFFLKAVQEKVDRQE